MRIVINLAILLFLSSCSYNELSLCESNNPSYINCIEPIFKQNCVSCHNNETQYGDLILESYSEISEAVLNGDVIARISLDELDQLFMPQSSSKLSENELQLITNWKENGAPNN